MHSDNRQSRVTYEDLHVLKCNNDSNVYILKYFRILKKKYMLTSVHTPRINIPVISNSRKYFFFTKYIYIPNMYSVF